jgi:hypothetical protein
VLALAACGGGPSKPVAAVAPPPARPAVDLPVLAGSAGACGGFDKLRDTIDVVDGRLKVAAPKGAADIPKAYSIMGAPEPTAHESRVIVEDKRGGKLVVFAHELWQSAPADLATRVPGYFKATMRGAAADIGKIDADPALVVIGAKPTTPDKDPDAILLLSTLVRVADGSLLGVDYYVNPPAFGDGCQGLALELARGMKPSKRELDVKGGKRTLGNRVDIDVPAGYVVTHQPGPDFDVFFLHKLVPLGDYPGYLLVYLGDYADREVPSGDGTPVSRKGKLAGESATWEGFTSPHGGSIVATVNLRGREQLQVAEVATMHGEFLDELDKIAQTIRRH